MQWVMTRAGAVMASANRNTLLRDLDGDGIADVRSTFSQHLNSPFGMEVVTDTFYAANTDAVLAFPCRTSVRDGGFYCWPFSYFGQHVDALRVNRNLQRRHVRWTAWLMESQNSQWI